MWGNFLSILCDIYLQKNDSVAKNLFLGWLVGLLVDVYVRDGTSRPCFGWQSARNCKYTVWVLKVASLIIWHQALKENASPPPRRDTKIISKYACVSLNYRQRDVMSPEHSNVTDCSSCPNVHFSRINQPERGVLHSSQRHISKDLNFKKCWGLVLYVINILIWIFIRTSCWRLQKHSEKRPLMSSCLYVRPSAPNSVLLTHNGFFTKFDIWVFFGNISWNFAWN